jgi:glycosyltransferase involved in cell wall biosynthesis
MKTIAIAIAAYNTPEFIVDCVNSVMMQEISHGWNYDIRIGVDGCKRTSEILMKAKVKHYYSYNNVGAYQMRNSLLNLRPVDAYGYFDSDDVMKPDYLKHTVQLIESGHRVIMLAKTEVDQTLRAIPGRVHHVQDGGAITFTAEIWQKLGGYQPFRCAGDTDYMRRIAMAGYHLHKEKDKSYYLRRKHQKSLTRSGKTRFGGDYRKQAWSHMCQQRRKGIIYVKPIITELEER